MEVDTLPTSSKTMLNKFLSVRGLTEELCSPLLAEDYVVQPIADVSPPKWHLGHTTWFFEEFILSKQKKYKRFNDSFAFVFNSYYESVGEKIIRTNRGNLTRPVTSKVYEYRAYVNEHMFKLFNSSQLNEFEYLIEIGLNHEQQHQELLQMDIKYILGNNPLFPSYRQNPIEQTPESEDKSFLNIKEGVYTIGHSTDSFCYDNELNNHKTYIQNFEISNTLITNEEWIEFINDGGYKNFIHWHSEGWTWVNENKITAPLYWHKINNQWQNYTLSGLKPVNKKAPVNHISYYEAYAFAEWKKMRLPTEFEWEVASNKFTWGKAWEWTQSAYLPYPGFKKADGALGEYNGKFMVNQMVLRGASIATPKNHSRNTYRNFFHPHLRWMYSGLRLVK